MRVVIGADHAGYALKEVLRRDLEALGHDVLDVGAFTGDQPDDYPDFAAAVGRAVREGQAERGVLICGSGVGASVAANKLRGIRAAVCHDNYSAHQGVEHDDMNVLVLGSRVIGVAVARELQRTFLAARFTGEERHVRRLGKVQALEDANLPGDRE
jgi:RpiB/LacA/LacB family sugar-phosphate isomerase